MVKKYRKGTFKIKNQKLLEAVAEDVKKFPKYTSQIINLANRNSQATRPRVVGQLTELTKECPYKSYKEWKKWYFNKYPNAVENATKKILPILPKIEDAMTKITQQMVKDWVEDLVIGKTFVGLKSQEAILKTIAEKKKTTYRLANPKEESKGIDGYIGDTPVSIKPVTYKTKDMYIESIEVKIIFYEKKKDGILVDVSQLD
ncbi:MjaI family restriction endonuclease [Candidatus Woesearchaeota archaeon]|nr:MjaI family restriction endonuclease [Candidatus Woesearchaeota archaeon]